MTNCTTHHKACDCREAMFADMFYTLENARAIFDQLVTPDMSASPHDIYFRAKNLEAHMRALIARATDQGEMK